MVSQTTTSAHEEEAAPAGSCCRNVLRNLSAPKPRVMFSASHGSPSGKKQRKAVSFCLLQEKEEDAVSFCLFDVVRALLPVGSPSALVAGVPSSAEKEEAAPSCFFNALRGLFPLCITNTALTKATAVVIEELEEEEAAAPRCTVPVSRPPLTTVTVTVRDVDGAILLGPANLETSQTVAELSEQVLDQCQARDAEVCQVELVHATGKLDGSTHLREVQGSDASSAIELTAVVESIELSEWRRQRYIEAMLGFWRQLRVRPQELLKFPPQFRADRECMLAALRKTGSEALLEHAHKRLLANRQFMMEAVRVRGCALRYASNGLKEDSELVLEAARQNSEALRYAGVSCGSTPPPSCVSASGRRAPSICLPRIPSPSPNSP